MTTSPVAAVASGSAMDLLGDEISEVPTVVDCKPEYSLPADATVDAQGKRSLLSTAKHSGHTDDLLSEPQPGTASLRQPGAVALRNSEDGSPQQQQTQAAPIEPSGTAYRNDQQQKEQQAGKGIRAEKTLLADGQSRGVMVTAAQEKELPPVHTDEGSQGAKPKNNDGPQSLPSEAAHARQSADCGPSDNVSEGPSSQGSECEERMVDSDREVVEEEDAFGDFADFTSASHFLPGGAGTGLGAAALGGPPPAFAPAVTAARAMGTGLSSVSSPSAHRHAHLGGLARPLHNMLGVGGGAASHHGLAGGLASISGAVSELGSLAGEFSDFSHQSPPPSVAPSRGGGGRKSVASIASVGSRAGGDDDLGDYNSVVGSSVWRAPSQMATSSYAAAAGADDDFGDFTSDITSTSDFAPSTQPPSAVAVSGPGSVHPDDDFGSFASHRSTADDDEDDFGNFNAAPAAAAASAVAGTGAGPSGSGAAAAAGGGTAGYSGPAAAVTSGAGTASGGAAAAFSPRDLAAAATATSGAHPYHSTQSVGPLPGSSVSTTEAAAATDAGLLQLPPSELRQAVARALQPLLPPATPVVGMPHIPDEQTVSAAWAQLRRHMQGNATEPSGVNGSIVAHNGVPLPSLGTAVPPTEAASGQDGSAGRNGFVPAVKFTRTLRWKGSDSERRLLSGLGLSELAVQARMGDVAEGPRPAGRARLDPATGSGGAVRQGGPLASFGDAQRKMRMDPSSLSAGLYRDTECDGAPLGSGNAAGSGSSRSRGLDQNGEAYGYLPVHGGGPPSGGTPRAASGANGSAGGQQQQPLGCRFEK
ncbi:hypothetical protein VOLCADRAFT_89179 [Volvox carteri f. nagariensis]|uniref:Uncharacterized protein n=1 Tax=Volvox carteri f. nagariensis TaxID=3068 RepID=D8TR04_VOLCA|nr:uncharacterized protein VOLCADRAFT_89179 [Volvox carteri f. nagariensis]EFJ50116.1 hypothetical protein VOLCADRAFT_89179 [Volvox carteri f. nagariensis]|eukprot:XP_002948736.1 hypothetical protein VOLCADRAFT_89179 [Volvox carteri f. nagariensis]